MDCSKISSVVTKPGSVTKWGYVWPTMVFQTRVD